MPRKLQYLLTVRHASRTYCPVRTLYNYIKQEEEHTAPSRSRTFHPFHISSFFALVPLPRDST